MENKISIIVPVYNAEIDIEKCIDSIVNQSYSNWELILINDGSTDNSLNKCIAFQTTDSRIVIIDQVNSGPSIARNKGIEKANGQYIVFVDADDYVDEFYLEKLLQPYLESLDVQLSCGGYIELSKYNKKGVVLHDFKSFLDKNSVNQSLFFENLFKGVTGVLWGKMFLSSIIKNYFITLDPKIRLSEDLLFVFEYATHIEKIALVKEYLYYYNRLNENGLSGQLNLSNLKDIKHTNHRLTELNLKVKISNIESVLLKRYTDGVIKITKDIAVSQKPIQQKIRDLKFASIETKEATKTSISSLSKENKIHLILFSNRQFLVLIIFNSLFHLLRNLKNSI